MAAAHKGAISFGLVHIPIELYKTTQPNEIAFNQLCKDTHERVRYKKYCPSCSKEIKNDDIVKGYQYEKDRYVIMSQEEIDSLKAEKDRTIHILHFTSLSDVSDLYFEKNYYAIPEKSAQKAYELLYKALHSLKVIAIGQCVIGTKETLVAIMPFEEGLMVKTLFYEDEIAKMPKDIVHPKTSAAELKMAKQLIEAMKESFDPSLYHDSFQEKLKNVIEAKIHGQKIVSATPMEKESAIDLMEALTQSLTAKKAEKRAH